MWWWLVASMAIGWPSAADAAPFAWLAHYGAKVARLDLATHDPVSVVAGANPISTAASLDGRRAYSHSGTDQTVSVIEAPAMTLFATVPVPGYPSATP